MIAEKRKAGRPRIDSGAAKGAIFSIRLSIDERAEITRAARAAGLSSASEWARETLLTIARRAAS